MTKKAPKKPVKGPAKTGKGKTAGKPAAAPSAPQPDAGNGTPQPEPQNVKLPPVETPDVGAGASAAGIGSVEGTVKLIAAGVAFIIFISALLYLNTPSFLAVNVGSLITNGFKSLKGDY